MVTLQIKYLEPIEDISKRSKIRDGCREVMSQVLQDTKLNLFYIE